MSHRLDGIELRINVLRELTSMRSVDREFLSRDELGVLLLELFEEEREEILADQKLYAAMGILDEGIDLFDLLLGLYSEGVLGLYRAEEEKFYVVGGPLEFDPEQVRTYVHEFVHALQQQHYDFDATFNELENNSDAAAALSALLEGDARLTEAAYTFEYMDDEERAISEGQASNALMRAYRAAPHVIQRQYLFPYMEGMNFAVSLYRTEGWVAMDRAFGDLPQSTEQILHPEKYASREAPLQVVLPDLVEAMGEGWSLIRRDTFGEFMFQAYFEAGMSKEQAAAAAQGWGGDSLSLLEGPDGEILLVLSALWDREADATEFTDAFLAFTNRRTGVEWELLDDQSSALMVLTDQVIFIDLNGTETVVIFAPGADVLGAVRAALSIGADPSGGPDVEEGQISPEPSP